VPENLLMYNNFGSQAFKPRIVVSAPPSERLFQFYNSSAIKDELDELAVSYWGSGNAARVGSERVGR
jgi:hypothetical protein